MILEITEYDHDVEFAQFLLRKYVHIKPINGTAFDMKVESHLTTYPDGFVEIHGMRVDMDDPDVTPFGAAAIQLVDIYQLEIY